MIVGGHSHTLFSNTDPDACPYPTLVKNPSGRDVPIVQAKAYSKYLGELKLTFDDDGNVTASAGAPILLDFSVTPDAAFVARVNELAKPIEELKSRKVAGTPASSKRRASLPHRRMQHGRCCRRRHA